MRLYRERVSLFLKLNPRCAVFASKMASQVHHRYGRGHGGCSPLLLWEPGWVSVSSQGHLWIDAHRDEARQRGLLAPRGAWNNYERAVAHLETIN
jgi:hypothetical protein